MAENSSIEWTHHTFNPWIGCTKVSAACDHCYAEAWDHRFGGERWGPKSARTRTSPANWRKPLAWNRQAAERGTRYRVFCASLADVFDNHRSIERAWRLDLWALIESTPDLDWLLLTKRPQNIHKLIPEWAEGGAPRNVWLGTTAENTQEARRRIPHLLRIPATVHFLSCEPLLGAIDLTRFLKLACWDCDPEASAICPPGWCLSERPSRRINWVIAGGESGTQYRPADPAWFRSLRDQCAAAGVPFLFKQWDGRHQREIKAKGRALDGVVHDGYPG